MRFTAKDLIVVEYYRDYFTVRANLKMKAEVNKGIVTKCSPPGIEKLVLKAVEQYKKNNPGREKAIYCLDNNLLVKYQGVEVKPLNVTFNGCECEILKDTVFKDSYGLDMPERKGNKKLIDFVDLEFSI